MSKEEVEEHTDEGGKDLVWPTCDKRRESVCEVLWRKKFGGAIWDLNKEILGRREDRKECGYIESGNESVYHWKDE